MEKEKNEMSSQFEQQVAALKQELEVENNELKEETNQLKNRLQDLTQGRSNLYILLILMSSYDQKLYLAS